MRFNENSVVLNFNIKYKDEFVMSFVFFLSVNLFYLCPLKTPGNSDQPRGSEHPECSDCGVQRPFRSERTQYSG